MTPQNTKLLIDTGLSELTTNIQFTTIGISMQQFYSVIQYNAIKLSVLLKGHYSYKLQFINSARWQDILTSSRIIIQIYVISIWLWN